MAGSDFADQALAAATNAYASVPGRWELAVPAAIFGLFVFLAGRPERTAACVAGHRPSGSDGLESRDGLIERFVPLLEPGFRLAAKPPGRVVAEAIGGGIFEIVRGHAVENRLPELPAAAPAATVVALSPFLGPEAAAELAETTKVQTDG